MSTRPSGRRRTPAAAAPTPGRTGNAFVDVFADGAREQCAMWLEASGAFTRGLDALRAIGQRTASETAARHQLAARRLRQAAGTGDPMTWPWTVWQDDAASALRYWQDIAASVLETQTRMLGCACGHSIDSESALYGAGALEAVESLPGVRKLVDSGDAIAHHALPH